MSDSQTDPIVPGGLDPELYDELRRIASRHLRSERPDHTLQPTALVAEMYLKLDRRRRPAFADRRHFLAVASVAMRAILVDYARARLADKRGGGAVHITVSEANAITDDQKQQTVLDVDAALTRLHEYDPELEQIVVMRFFAGMTEAEVAETVGKSDRWVRSQWAFARAWLRRVLEEPKD